MTRQRRQFHAETAVRDRMPIMVGFTGPSGSGKTLSAIRFGTGICQTVREGPLVVIDADSGRAKQYAPLPGQDPHPPETYAFERISLDAPYGSLDFADAIEYASHDRKAAAIVVDPFCREHYGPGGYLDVHDHEAEKIQAANKQDKGGSWVEPVKQRKRMFERISAIGTRSALLFCFRAVPKLNWNTPRGKGPEEKGIVPATSSLFVWDMLCNIWFPYNANGKPEWDPQLPGEIALVKGAPVWARDIFRGQVTEETGRRVALWALGDVHEEVRRREQAKESDEKHNRLMGEIRSNLQERGFSMRADPDALVAEIERCFGCDPDKLAHLENIELSAGLELLRNPPSETVVPVVSEVDLAEFLASLTEVDREGFEKALVIVKRWDAELLDHQRKLLRSGLHDAAWRLGLNIEAEPDHELA